MGRARDREVDEHRHVRFVRGPELGSSELSYVQTTAGAAPPDVRSMLEVILVDESDKTIIHRGRQQHIRSGLVGIRSAYEVGRLVRRHAPRTRVRVLALADDELTSSFEAVRIKPRDVQPTLTYLDVEALGAAASAVFSAVETRAPALAVQTRLAECALQVVPLLAAPTTDRASAPDKGSAARIRDVLHDRLTEDVSLDDLARQVGLSRTYVVHAFRRVFQLPPYEYLMHVRVAKARDLLAAGGRPVDVAHACGFCDQSHLNRWFRAVVGVTPGKYGPISRPTGGMRGGTE
jgi:AraC-like DNA-binding protein